MNHSNHRPADVVYHPGESESYRYVRSSNGMFAGICEGISKQVGIPAWAIRVIWILFTLLAFGTGIIIYMILAFCLPDEDSVVQAEQKKLLGVCLRLSRAFNMEVGVVRALTVLLALASLGITIVGYIILNFVLPDRPKPLF